ncbi:hypothetical protein Back2_24890 [Nocardioides baekrokdamisoli]|uniref:YfhO family protein n=1 Tax=Nocardioides baekrokdamisoli TaxID=1804624 RepID=A0A3G9IJ51_9ACTN|nr:hypothetical protein [Nocardioides baekrokdamisoli]BBH18202.1 hypothetical protein Back2_24890 [Nocardioides baekrokdamisoli]
MSRMSSAIRREWVPLLLIVVVVLVANGSYIVGLRSNDPLQYRASLGPAPVGVVQGRTTIDRNDGYTSQALGRRAAEELLHGHLPLWNPYEGIGMPLAGEMQSAALFPFTLIQLFDNGIFLEHLLLEILGGVATYLFLRRLRIGRAGSLAGGALFAVNGTFVWLTNAAFNPVALLPVALLGVELIASASTTRRRSRGWVVLALGLGLSLLAGFPETALIDGLLVGAYAVLRLAQLRGVRRRYLLQLVAGGFAGVALATPVLAAFAAYVGFANVGTHAGACARMTLPHGSMSGWLFPYIYGPIFGQSDPWAPSFLHQFWGNVGGYGSLAALLVALTAFRARAHRAYALLFGGAGLVLMGRIFGAPIIVGLVNLVPGMSQTCAQRYSQPAVSMCLAVLVAIGIDSWGQRSRRWDWAWFIAGAGIIGGLAVVAALPHLDDHVPHHVRWAVVSVAWASAILIGLTLALVLARRGHGRGARSLAAALIALDAMAMFAVPQTSAGPESTVDTAAVDFLQSHVGLHRVMTFGVSNAGVMDANYGTYFGIAQLSLNDLPYPKLFSDLATTDLYPGTAPGVLFPGSPARGRTPGPVEQAFLAHVTAYRAAGVAYVITSDNRLSPVAARAAGLTEAYRDSWAVIWAVPDPAPYFQPVDAACVVVPLDRQHVRVTCPSATRLARNEMYAPGWSASIDGHDAPVSAYRPDGLTVAAFQQIQVPAGTSTITFRYWPAHFSWSLVAAGTAVLAMLGSCGWSLIGARLRRSKGSAKSVTSP